MAKSRKPKSALPYIQRVLEDEFVQEQLRNAAQSARAVYARARKQRSRAADDKVLYRNLRKAVTSIRNAAIVLQRPEPPKRRMRKAATIGLAIGGCALWTRKLQKSQRVREDDASPEQHGSSYAPAGKAHESVREPQRAGAHRAS